MRIAAGSAPRDFTELLGHAGCVSFATSLRRIPGLAVRRSLAGHCLGGDTPDQLFTELIPGMTSPTSKCDLVLTLPEPLAATGCHRLDSVPRLCPMQAHAGALPARS
jgi:hypothetical protein